MRADLKAVGDAVIEAVKGYVARSAESLVKRLDALEKRLADMPAGPQGERGEKGDSGPVGEKGEPGIAGKDGRDGVNGKDGEPGKDGMPGRNGVDGKSLAPEDVAPMLEGYFAKWALEFERRAQDVLQKAVDRMPAPKDGVDGRDGRDGLGFEDMEVKHDGDRTVTVRFARGDFALERSFKLPVVLDRGVFKEGDAYERGDGVTWAGSYWIAQKEAPTGKPGEPGSDGWRLAVKRGRDGRDGRDGIDKTATVKL